MNKQPPTDFRSVGGTLCFKRSNFGLSANFARHCRSFFVVIFAVRVCKTNTAQTDILVGRGRLLPVWRGFYSRRQTNFGRGLVFSAELCYNGANEKPPSEREPLDALVHLQGYGLSPKHL